MCVCVSVSSYLAQSGLEAVSVRPVCVCVCVCVCACACVCVCVCV